MEKITQQCRLCTELKGKVHKDQLAGFASGELGSENTAKLRWAMSTSEIYLRTLLTPHHIKEAWKWIT